MQPATTEPAASTADDASDSMPPTTGSAEDMTVRVALMAAASILVVISELMPSRAVKARVVQVSAVFAAHFVSFAAAASMGFGKTTSASVRDSVA